MALVYYFDYTVEDCRKRLEHWLAKQYLEGRGEERVTIARRDDSSYTRTVNEWIKHYDVVVRK